MPSRMELRVGETVVERTTGADYEIVRLDPYGVELQLLRDGPRRQSFQPKQPSLVCARGIWFWLAFARKSPESPETEGLNAGQSR